MANLLSIAKAKSTQSRKLPLLPRLGVTVDFAGFQLSYKQAPFSETLLNLYERGFTLANFLKVSEEQVREIDFPKSSTSSPSSKKAKSRKAASRRRA